MTAMGDRASRRGAVDLGMPLMVLSILVMIGFMYWLFLQGQKQAAEKEAVAQQMRADSVEAERLAALRGQTVSGEALQTDPSVFAGRLVTVEGLRFTGTMGTQGWWLELPNGNPFLVSLSPAVVARGETYSAGQSVTVSGTIVAMGDSILDAWSGTGAIGEGDRLAAEYATYFMEASNIEVSATATPTGAGGEG
jgi:cytoskeletal protein RodZ